jgi:hypothetical protein
MARRDLLKIVEFIANDNPDAADKLLDEIELKANGLREDRSFTEQGVKRGRVKWSCIRITLLFIESNPKKSKSCALSMWRSSIRDT